MLGFLVLISVATSGDAIEAGKWLTYAHAYGMALLFAATAFVFVILNAFAGILAFCKPSMYRGRGDKVLGLSVMVIAIIANASLIALLRLFPYDHITGWLRAP